MSFQSCEFGVSASISINWPDTFSYLEKPLLTLPGILPKGGVLCSYSSFVEVRRFFVANTSVLRQVSAYDSCQVGFLRSAPKTRRIEQEDIVT
jgi:hypothetical protein